MGPFGVFGYTCLSLQAKRSQAQEINQSMEAFAEDKQQDWALLPWDLWMPLKSLKDQMHMTPLAWKKNLNDFSIPFGHFFYSIVLCIWEVSRELLFPKSMRIELSHPEMDFVESQSVLSRFILMYVEQFVVSILSIYIYIYTYIHIYIYR